MSFKLNPQFEKDAEFICRLNLCQTRLMKKSEWLWLLLIPEVNDITEIFQLSAEDRQTLTAEISQVSEQVKNSFNADKMNIAAFGNVVSQLHIHVIARNRNDHNWPAPVFNDVPAEEYSSAELEQLKNRLTRLLGH